MPTTPADSWDVEPAGAGETWPTGAVEPPVACVTDGGGAVDVVGAAGRWCTWPPTGGDVTTIFSGGGDAGREPTGGRCTVPESRSSAIAAAPRSSGIRGAATRRAATHSASHLVRSSADTDLSSPSQTGLPGLRPEITRDNKKLRRTATRVRGTFAVSGAIIGDTTGVTPDERIRCWPTTDPGYIAYHDEEWGRPVRDERGLYERLCLEGFQSGLAWITVLRKREAFRLAFAGFDFERVARFGDKDVARLLGDAAIIRHRGKIEATIANAKATLALREAGTPLGELMWEYRDRADGKELSRRLKAAGFRFVGPTTVYSSLEACGIVNGHRPDCWVRDAVEAERRAVR
jgi:DNA-3-methyladenine glycosylase I